MSHTPGPWEIRSSIPYGDGYTIFHGRFEQNYTVCTWTWKYGNVEADARLIAAAPDLLEALQGVLPYMEAAENAGLVGHEGCHWPVEIVRAAIAKATRGPL